MAEPTKRGSKCPIFKKRQQYCQTYLESKKLQYKYEQSASNNFSNTQKL